jgi:hypothetical protein
MNEQVSGFLLSAYRDEDFHLVETIVYSDNGNEVKSTIFLLEQSGLHNVLMPQDSIYKESGSLDFVVIRNGERKVYELSYGCNEKLDEIGI